MHNVGLNLGGRPDCCLADLFWETVHVSLERQGGGVPASSVPLVAPAPTDAPAAAAPATPHGRLSVRVRVRGKTRARVRFRVRVS